MNDPRAVSEILRSALINIPQLARLAGLQENTVRSLRYGKRERPRAGTRRKLARAFRQHASTLLALADQLEARAP
jgi:transcriptional regulator with XRE-family HTH domain